MARLYRAGVFASIVVLVQASSGFSESEEILGIVDDTEEKSQKDQVVTASKPSKPLLT